MKPFESVAEEKTYPILKEFAEQNGYELTNQIEVFAHQDRDWRDWVYKKYDGELPDWLDDIHDDEHEDGNCRFCYGGKDYLAARIDFVMTRVEKYPNSDGNYNIRKIAIEIDGAEFHRDKQSDAKRDVLLSNKGYEIVRIPAKFVLYPKNFKDRAKNILRLKVGWRIR